MSAIKQRDSNLELLRIVAMSMIVIYHIFVHGISPVYVGSHSILTVWYAVSYTHLTLPTICSV